jgi:hypothetical protein
MWRCASSALVGPAKNDHAIDERLDGTYYRRRSGVGPTPMEVVFQQADMGRR